MNARVNNRTAAEPPNTLPMIMPVLRADPMFTGDTVVDCAGAGAEVTEEGNGCMVLLVLAWALERGMSVSRWEELRSLTKVTGVDEIPRANNSGKESGVDLKVAQLEVISVVEMAGAGTRVKRAA